MLDNAKIIIESVLFITLMNFADLCFVKYAQNLIMKIFAELCFVEILHSFKISGRVADLCRNGSKCDLQICADLHLENFPMVNSIQILVSTRII
jgi:hypothetical protein